MAAGVPPAPQLSSHIGQSPRNSTKAKDWPPWPRKLTTECPHAGPGVSGRGTLRRRGQEAPGSRARLNLAPTGSVHQVRRSQYVRPSSSSLPVAPPGPDPRARRASGRWPAPRRAVRPRAPRWPQQARAEPPTCQNTSMRSLTSRPAFLRASWTIRTISAQLEPARRRCAVSSRSSATVSAPSLVTAHPLAGLWLTISSSAVNVMPPRTTDPLLMQGLGDASGRRRGNPGGDLFHPGPELLTQDLEVRFHRHIDDLAGVT